MLEAETCFQAWIASKKTSVKRSATLSVLAQLQHLSGWAAWSERRLLGQSGTVLG